MDLQMPEVDGYEATLAIRRQEAAGARVPIVALSAATRESVLERCLAPGMDDCIRKPLRVDTLGAALAKWLPEGKER